MSDSDECPELVTAKVPVTVLTGFLGSGKTTLLHYVLTAEHQLRIAVIVNEFEFGRAIEKGLTLKSSQKPDDEWLELSNGCMCCTAQTQIVQALESLVRKKGTFDLVLVETSGLADPGPVASMFWQDEAVCGSLYLSGILTLVDSKNVTKYIGDPELSAEITRQILMADRIILNKCDVASAEEQLEALQCVQRINPVAQVVKVSFSRIEGIREFLFLNTTRNLSGVEHLHTGPGTGAGNAISALSLEFGAILAPGASGDPQVPLAVPSRRDVDLLCRDLLYHGDEERFEVLRAKAAIWAVREDGTCALYQVQSIGDTFDVTEMAGHTVPYGCSRALLLGRRLDEQRIRDIFSKFLRPIA